MEIKFENVTYEDKLKNLNIVFKKNQITAIIGSNDFEKSTILSLIYGIKLPTSGEILINNNKIDKEASQKNLKKIRNNISYLLDDDEQQLFNINILEDIKYGIKNFDEKKMYELLELFKLSEEILTKNYMELSKGEKRKILLISIFLRNSKVILLDKPTKGLDYNGIQALIKILKREKRLGKIIIIISYNSDFLLEVCDNVLVVYDKKIVTMDVKYKIFKLNSLLKKANQQMPNVSLIEKKVLEIKNKKLGNRDNINDLIKDIYRNAK